jgi:Xaa-Pro aminopeptidase
LRGSDIPFNPVFFAYCVISTDRVDLFVGESALTAEALKHLEPVKAVIHEYSEIFRLKHPYKNIHSSATCSLAIQSALGVDIKVS